MRKVPPLFSDCSPLRGNRKTAFNSSRDAFLSLVPPCSPFIETKKSSRVNRVEESKKDIYRDNNRKKGGTGEHPTEMPAFPDSRFESEDFRFCVHVVLEYFGLAATFGNFKKLESQFGEDIQFDWYETAVRILNPSHEARVYRLITNPRVGHVGTRCGTMIVELQGVTKEEALKNLDTKKYELIEWW